MCQNHYETVAYVFREFNFVARWNKCRTIFLVRWSLQITKQKYLFHIQGQGMTMWTCLFLIVILKETLVLMCLASHFDVIESSNLIVGHRDIYYAKKILNSFECVEVRILVEKWNIHEAHIFPRPLLQTCRLETTSLCLNTRLRVNKKFQNSPYFYSN